MDGDLQKVSEAITKLIADLQLSLRDAEKFDKGNVSAGVRVRKKAQEAIKQLKDIRKLVSDTKDSRKSDEE
jgi:hypothetical protein